jgi:hypothetical protein
VPNRSAAPSIGGRDLRIDWLRGLAMACVIVNHSKRTSLLSWFSYERFWIVTAAEVFVVLSGVVLGMVYGRRLARDGWRAVVAGLGRRAVLLYFTFIVVTLSVLALSFGGFDVRAVTSPTSPSVEWVLDPRLMDAAAWRAVAFMRYGPWPFEIIGMYVWLVAAAVPCLIALHLAGWRPLLAASWAIYLGYRIAEPRLTGAEFEAVFPVLAWQLPFVHGIVIGFNRDRIAGFVADRPQLLSRGGMAALAVCVTFAAFALCNPWLEGPRWLHWNLVTAERFSVLYAGYFGLTELGIGRLVNLAVGLPVGYAVLTWCWRFAQPLSALFITLGRRSLGAFLLHVYGVLLLARLPIGDSLWINTFAQVLLIVAIAAVLSATPSLRVTRRRPAPLPQVQPIAA